MTHAARPSQHSPLTLAAGFVAACALALSAGCAAHTTATREPPAAPDVEESAGLHVFLTWSAPVDLDLYLTDPSSESLYFANNPTRSGSRLLSDVRCDTLKASSAAVEHAEMPAPPTGAYRVGVDFLDACGTGLELVPFRISVDHDDLHLEKSGEARAGEFLVIGFEFEIGE